MRTSGINDFIIVYDNVEIDRKRCYKMQESIMLAVIEDHCANVMGSRSLQNANIMPPSSGYHQRLSPLYDDAMETFNYFDFDASFSIRFYSPCV